MNYKIKATAQTESTHIVKPFIAKMRDEGWICENIHGNQFQKGLPDYFCYNSNGIFRWIEFKVCHGPNAHVKLQPAQKIKFPQMFYSGLPIYVVADYDLRGNDMAINCHYKRVVFGKPNVDLLFSPRTFKSLPSGFCKRT